MKTLARVGKRRKPLLRPCDGCEAYRDPGRAGERKRTNPISQAAVTLSALRGCDSTQVGGGLRALLAGAAGGRRRA